MIAFAMAPARGVSQTLADRLFLGDPRPRLPRDGEQGRRDSANRSDAAEVARAVRENDRRSAPAPTVSSILLADAAGVRAGDTRRRERDGSSRSSRRRTSDHRILEAQSSEPLVLDELYRIRATPELDEIKRRSASARASTSRSESSLANTSSASCSSGRAYPAASTAASNKTRFRCFAGSSRSRSRTRSSLPRCRTRKSTTKRCCKISRPA